MSTIDEIIKEFALIQLNYSYLDTISLFRRSDDSESANFDITMILADSPNSPHHNKMFLKFEGVQDLKMNEIINSLALAICITNVSDSQLENINLKVREDENNTFSFCCKKFNFKVS